MKSNGNYDWKFSTIGGATRVCINSGEDIAHLGELDQKYWTVLSCPVKGLEIEEATLTLLDNDHDGKIRVNEILDASKWLCKVLKDPDLLTDADNKLPLSSINEDDDEGRSILESARGILAKLGLEQDYINLDNLAAASKLSEEKTAEIADTTVFPFGENTAAALDACTAVRDKIDDFFMRCKLASFNAGSQSSLDVTVESIAAISSQNLAKCQDTIASYPVAHVNAEGILHLEGSINPVWKKAVETFRTLAFAGKTEMTESEWNATLAKFDAYRDYMANKTVMSVEKTEIEVLTKLARLYRDFFTILNNFVTFRNFYSNGGNRKAVFQAGTLYIDQRSCDLCIKVSDMTKHEASADLSGLYLLYCDCTCKSNAAKMTIVAAMTDGDVNGLRVGKNAIFYDRSGLDWDAVVIKIIDNPISLKQAFWSPYRKFGRFISESIEKFASDRESKVISKGTEDISNAGTKIANAPAADAANKQAFDISKFAGIFAMIGMALGTILGFFLDLFSKFFALKIYQMFLVIIAIMLIISGPSMIKAWIKLRKRNIAPLLNANGWAVNSGAVINVKFGATLTSLAVMPISKGIIDPLADKPVPKWKKVLAGLFVIAVVAASLYFSTPADKRPFRTDKAKTEVQSAPAAEQASAPADAQVTQ